MSMPTTPSYTPLPSPPLPERWQGCRITRARRPAKRDPGVPAGSDGHRAADSTRRARGAARGAQSEGSACDIHCATQPLPLGAPGPSAWGQRQPLHSPPLHSTPLHSLPSPPLPFPPLPPPLGPHPSSIVGRLPAHMRAHVQYTGWDRQTRLPCCPDSHARSSWAGVMWLGSIPGGGGENLVWQNSVW